MSSAEQLTAFTAPEGAANDNPSPAVLKQRSDLVAKAARKGIYLAVDNTKSTAASEVSEPKEIKRPVDIAPADWEMMLPALKTELSQLDQPALIKRYLEFQQERASFMESMRLQRLRELALQADTSSKEAAALGADAKSKKRAAYLQQTGEAKEIYGEARLDEYRGKMRARNDEIRAARARKDEIRAENEAKGVAGKAWAAMKRFGAAPFQNIKQAGLVTAKVAEVVLTNFTGVAAAKGVAEAVSSSRTAARYEETLQKLVDARSQHLFGEPTRDKGGKSAFREQLQNLKQLDAQMAASGMSMEKIEARRKEVAQVLREMRTKQGAAAATARKKMRSTQKEKQMYGVAEKAMAPFLYTTGATGAGIGVFGAALAARMALRNKARQVDAKQAAMTDRRLGKTGEAVTDTSFRGATIKGYAQFKADLASDDWKRRYAAKAKVLGITVGGMINLDATGALAADVPAMSGGGGVDTLEGNAGNDTLEFPDTIEGHNRYLEKAGIARSDWDQLKPEEKKQLIDSMVQLEAVPEPPAGLLVAESEAESEAAAPAPDAAQYDDQSETTPFTKSNSAPTEASTRDAEGSRESAEAHTFAEASEANAELEAAEARVAAAEAALGQAESDLSAARGAVSIAAGEVTEANANLEAVTPAGFVDKETAASARVDEAREALARAKDSSQADIEAAKREWEAAQAVEARNLSEITRLRADIADLEGGSGGVVEIPTLKVQKGDTISELTWESLRGRGSITVPAEYQAQVDGLKKGELLNRMYKAIEDLRDEPGEVESRMNVKKGNLDLIYPNDSLDITLIYERMFPGVSGGVDNSSAIAAISAQITGLQNNTPDVTALKATYEGKLAAGSGTAGTEAAELQKAETALAQVRADAAAAATDSAEYQTALSNSEAAAARLDEAEKNLAAAEKALGEARTELGLARSERDGLLNTADGETSAVNAPEAAPIEGGGTGPEAAVNDLRELAENRDGQRVEFAKISPTLEKLGFQLDEFDDSQTGMLRSGTMELRAKDGGVISNFAALTEPYTGISPEDLGADVTSAYLRPKDDGFEILVLEVAPGSGIANLGPFAPTPMAVIAKQFGNANYFFQNDGDLAFTSGTGAELEISEAYRNKFGIEQTDGIVTVRMELTDTGNVKVQLVSSGGDGRTYNLILNTDGEIVQPSGVEASAGPEAAVNDLRELANNNDREAIGLSKISPALEQLGFNTDNLTEATAVNANFTAIGTDLFIEAIEHLPIDNFGEIIAPVTGIPPEAIGGKVLKAGLNFTDGGLEIKSLLLRPDDVITNVAAIAPAPIAPVLEHFGGVNYYYDYNGLIYLSARPRSNSLEGLTIPDAFREQAGLTNGEIVSGVNIDKQPENGLFSVRFNIQGDPLKDSRLTFNTDGEIVQPSGVEGVADSGEKAELGQNDNFDVEAARTAVESQLEAAGITGAAMVLPFSEGGYIVRSMPVIEDGTDGPLIVPKDPDNYLQGFYGETAYEFVPFRGEVSYFTTYPDGSLLGVYSGHENGLTITEAELGGKTVPAGKVVQGLRFNRDGTIADFLDQDDKKITLIEAPSVRNVPDPAFADINQPVGDGGSVETALGVFTASNGESYAIVKDGVPDPVEFRAYIKARVAVVETPGNVDQLSPAQAAARAFDIYEVGGMSAEHGADRYPRDLITRLAEAGVIDVAAIKTYEAAGGTFFTATAAESDPGELRDRADELAEQANLAAATVAGDEVSAPANGSGGPTLDSLNDPVGGAAIDMPSWLSDAAAWTRLSVTEQADALRVYEGFTKTEEYINNLSARSYLDADALENATVQNRLWSSGPGDLAAGYQFITGFENGIPGEIENETVRNALSAEVEKSKEVLMSQTLTVLEALKTHPTTSVEQLDSLETTLGPVIENINDSAISAAYNSVVPPAEYTGERLAWMKMSTEEQTAVREGQSGGVKTETSPDVETLVEWPTDLGEEPEGYAEMSPADQQALIANIRQLGPR